MSEQNQIQFYKTMTSAKRGAGAYLRKNLLDTEEDGLYPSVDFTQRFFDGSDSREQGYFTINNFVFAKQSTATQIYRNTGSGALTYLRNMPSASAPIAVSETNDDDKVLVLLADGTLYTVDDTTTTQITTTFTSSASAEIVYDGFYWFISINTKLWRLDPDLSTLSIVKTTTTAGLQSEIVNMQIFNSYIVITRAIGANVQFDFWDTVTASADLYQKRVREENCRHLGVGVLKGTLIFVKSVGNSGNKKESEGNIVVSAFDGEKFVELNSIRAGGRDVTITGTQPQSVGNGMMVIAIQENADNLTDCLYKNWLLKIHVDGKIETLFEPDDYTDGFLIESVNIEYSTIAMLLQRDDGNTVFCDTDDSTTSYNAYENFTNAQYVTNLLNNAKNVHKMISFGISFEKVFSAISATKGERLYIDYRTSERDDWTLLHEVTSEKISKYTSDNFNKVLAAAEYANDSIGLTTQSYVITQMPDGKQLPRFNEIQFRFRTQKGFSLIQAWYDYDYIKRDTR